MAVEVTVDLPGAEKSTIEVDVDDIPPGVRRDIYDDLVWRRCADCGNDFLDAPDRKGDLTCNDHAPA